MASLNGKSGFEVTKLTFRKSALLQTMDQAEVKFLNRSGAFVRQSARSELKSSKQPSKPGQPPSSPTKRLKGSIFFAIEGSGGKVDCVIGPVQLGSTNRYVKTGGIPISKVLEEGGTVAIQQEQYADGSWHRVGLRNRPGAIRIVLPMRWTKVSVLARPFMKPALLSNIPKFAGIWRGLFSK